MNVHRNTPAIVPHRYRPIDMNDDFNFRAESSEMLVDRVIEHFKNQMVQTSLVRVPDKHAGPFANRLEALQFVDLRGVVFLCRADSGHAILRQFIDRNFVLSLRHMQASNGLKERIPKNGSETTNNLVVQATNFPLPVGGGPRPKPRYCGSFRLSEGLDFRCLDQFVLELENS